MAYSTIAQVRLKSGLTTAEVSDADITLLIPFADEEIERIAEQKYDDATSVSEYYNLYLPQRADDIPPNRILLDHYPVQSITSFVLVDSTETANATLDTLSAAEIAAGTYQSDDYYCDVTAGIIELSAKSFDFVPNRAKITYTYGFSSVPTYIAEISANFTGIRAWVNFLGGNYDRLNSYTIPEQSYNKGDFYDRGLKMIKLLSDNAEGLINQNIRKQRSQIGITNGGYY